MTALNVITSYAAPNLQSFACGFWCDLDGPYDRLILRAGFDRPGGLFAAIATGRAAGGFFEVPCFSPSQASVGPRLVHQLKSASRTLADVVFIARH